MVVQGLFFKVMTAQISPHITAENKRRNMAYIKIKKCRVGSIKKEGLTKNGEPYKMFSVAEGIKDKTTGKYDNMYFNCFAQGDVSKMMEEGLDITIEGSLSPNNWTGQDGKKHYGQTLFIKNAMTTGMQAPTPKAKAPKEEEEAMELPFD